MNSGPHACKLETTCCAVSQAMTFSLQLFLLLLPNHRELKTFFIDTNHLHLLTVKCKADSSGFLSKLIHSQIPLNYGW